MLKYALMAVAAATLVAIVFVMLPTGNVVRQEPRLLNTPDAAPATSFVIHDAPPPTPATPDPSATPPTPGSNLDTVMQRLRASAGNPAAPAPAVPPNAPTPDPAAAPALPPVVVTPTPTPTPAAPPAPQWTSVTAQGTRWRMAQTPDGYNVSIDLGGGQVANVRVAPAFGALDPAAINVRVDYLRDTIRQNFSAQSGNYTFARDGSVSIDR